MSVAARIHEQLQTCVRELVRFQALDTPQSFRQISRIDALHTINRPDGRGIFILGKVGATALHEASKLALGSDAKLRWRATVDSVRNEIKNRLLTEVFSGQTFDQTITERIISESLAAVAKTKLMTLTHVLPCILSHSTSRFEFSIGPVRFITTERFLEEYDADLVRYTQRTKRRWIWNDKMRIRRGIPEPFPPRNSKKWPRLEIERVAGAVESDARRYYSSYKWVAIVRVEDFDPNTSDQIAKISVETALNLLRLFLGAAHADDFRLGGNFRLEEKTSKIVKPKDGQLQIHFSRRSEHAIIDEDWIDIIFRDGDGYWITAAGGLIRWYQHSERLPIIYRRLLDALYWYGEGVAEPYSHAKIIRYSNALETFLGTRDQRLSEQISVRAAYFCADDVFSEAITWYKKVKAIYNLRSRLVHGDISPFDRSIGESVGDMEQIVRRVLLVGLQWTMWLAHQDPAMSVKRLHKHFERDLATFSYGLLADN